MVLGRIPGNITSDVTNIWLSKPTTSARTYLRPWPRAHAVAATIERHRCSCRQPLNHRSEENTYAPADSRILRCHDDGVRCRSDILARVGGRLADIRSGDRKTQPVWRGPQWGGSTAKRACQLHKHIAVPTCAHCVRRWAGGSRPGSDRSGQTLPVVDRVRSMGHRRQRPCWHRPGTAPHDAAEPADPAV